MLRVIKPEERAGYTAAELREVAVKLAEAQVAVLDALQTLEMFEHNFRVGGYRTQTVKEAFDADGISMSGDGN